MKKKKTYELRRSNGGAHVLTRTSNPNPHSKNKATPGTARATAGVRQTRKLLTSTITATMKRIKTCNWREI